MEIQTFNKVLMVKPSTFYYNEETAENNSFQVAPRPEQDCNKALVHEKAVSEFNGLVNLLQSNGVTVEVILEEPEPITTDSVFPNNWISFHIEESSDSTGISLLSPETNCCPIDELISITDRTAVLYPMWSKNRRDERKKLFPLLSNILPKETLILDLSPLEAGDRYLEGTGSLVLDRINKIAYACLSPRTTREAVELFCRRMGYKSVIFNAIDGHGKPCYHTNVMMSIADKYCIICLEAIENLGERVGVETAIKNFEKVLIPLSLEQMNEFAGNCLQLRGSQGTFLVMSSRAYKSLTEEQIGMIGQFDKILHTDVQTIENFGGGSVRCMIAEMGEVKVEIPAVTDNES